MCVNDRILRAIECQVLDRHHLKYSLLQRNVNDAISALLQCYGDVVRDLRNGSIPKNSDDARHQTENGGFRGLPHCIRWIQSNCPRLIRVPSPGNDQLRNEALALLQWGVKYDPLYNQHTAYTRKTNGQRFVEAEVSDVEKSITFRSRSTIDPRFFVSQVEARKADDARQATVYPDHELAQRFAAWLRSVNVGQDRVRFDDKVIASSGALDVAIEWLRASCLPELADTVRLGKFSAGSLRRFLAAFHVSSLFRIKLEDHSDQQQTQSGHRVLTHVLSWRIHELIDWLHEITKVDRSELEAIYPIFTFDGEPERVTVAHKPLILGADNRIFLSPALFLELPLSQMVVGALNLSPANKAAYDHISNSIEERIVDKLAGAIRTGCLQSTRMVSEKTFTLSDEPPITPDIVLLSADRSELLVIDVKNATPPFGVGDIANDLKTWSEKWVPQLERYVAAFKEQPDILAQHFETVNGVSPEVMGLILLRWPFPIPANVPNALGAIDWPTLLAHLSSKSDSGSIRGLWEWIRRRPDLAVVDALEWIPKKIDVVEWTYKYFVLSPSPGKTPA